MDRTDGSHWFYSYLPQGVAGGATSALIPLFAYALGGTLFTVGIIAAATSLASVPAFIFWGSLSDRFARRKVFLLIGFLRSGVALLVIGAALGLLSGLLAQVWTREPAVRVDRREVHVADVHARIERGRYLPIRILHFFNPLDWRKKVRLPRTLRIYLVCVFLLFGGFTAFYGFFPIFLKQSYGLGSPEIFAVYIASQATSIAVYPRVGRWVSSRGDRSTQLYASLGRSMLFPSFLLVGMAALPHGARLGAAIALHAGVGLCWALINVAGSILVSRLAPENGRAEAFGTYNAVQGFGSILGPLLGGFAAQYLGYAMAFGTSVALILAGCAILAATRVSEIGALSENRK